MKVGRVFFVVLPLLLLGFVASAQEEKIPQATVTPGVFQAPQKFDRVDRNKNKILDDLEKLVGPAATGDPFDVIVLLNRPLNLLPTLKGRHGNFVEKFTYPSINGFATNLTKGQIIAFSRDSDVKQVEYDAPVYPHLDTSQQWFGTTKARTDFGIDGDLDGAATYSKDDAVIAVIDTGIDYNHADLDGGKVIGQKCYCCSQLTPQGKCVKPCCPNGETEDDDALDDHGHGTHVSSIACGEGEGNSDYKGVAPGAALVGVKVLDSEGDGYMSYVNAGIQWVIDNKDILGIEVMNMSIGAAGSSDGTDSTSQLVNSMVDAGIVAVVSAGNEGPGKYTIGSPAAAAKAITVGAMADVYPGAGGSFDCGQAPGHGFYQICFSSRGPTADERIKPDISSPGVFIMAAKAGTTSDYLEYSGTSMSSPFTAGLAALMLHADQTLTPSQIKTKIMDTALDWGPSGDEIDYGAGRLDGYEAIESAGGWSGTNITTPEHQYFTGSLAGTEDEDWYDINVVNTSYPIAVTLIMPDWQSSSDPDFDLYLYDTDGTTELAKSIGTNRQETIGYQPTSTGTYKSKVYSYSGSGDYFFDQSAGTAVVSISLTTDGTTPFGIVALGATADTTQTGTNDVQTVQVMAGPADLSVRSTNFSDGTNTWTLSTAHGTDQVLWEFSKDATIWTAFSSANTLFTLDTNVTQGATRNFYLRLTMPTETSSNSEHSAIVTIVATAP